MGGQSTLHFWCRRGATCHDALQTTGFLHLCQLLSCRCSTSCRAVVPLFPAGGIDTEEDYGYWGTGLICQKKKEADRWGEAGWVTVRLGGVLGPGAAGVQGWAQLLGG